MIKKSVIEGEVRVQSYLHSNPKIKIYLNEDFSVGKENSDAMPGVASTTCLDFCTFHECASFNNWEEFHCLEFFVPDGMLS